MLKGLFNPDNSVMRFFRWVGYVWWLNILWLITSLPIITIGASTTALCYSCMKLREDDGYPTANFFHSFKTNFRQSTALWLIYLVSGALIGLALIFWNNQTIPGAKLAWGVVVAVGIFYFISILYVFALQSKFVNTVKDTIRYSFLIAFTNLKETFLIACIAAGFVLMNLFGYVIITFTSINIGMGLVAYFMSGHYARIFEKYMPAEDYEPDYDDDEEEAEPENTVVRERVIVKEL